MNILLTPHHTFNICNLSESELDSLYRICVIYIDSTSILFKMSDDELQPIVDELEVETGEAWTVQEYKEMMSLRHHNMIQFKQTIQPYINYKF